MVAIALAIGLISALTGNDVLGDLNTGTIVDGSGLGGIIGGSGSSTGTGSSSEAPGTSSGSGSSSGNDYIYKEEGVYYKDDLDLKWYYSDTLTSEHAVYFEFYVPESIGGTIWTVELSRPVRRDTVMGIYSYEDDGAVIKDSGWRWSDYNVFSVIQENVVCGDNGKMLVCYCGLEGWPTTDSGIKDLVESCMDDDFVLKVYPTLGEG